MPYSELEVRRLVLHALDNAEPCDLVDRLRRELRRNCDANTPIREKQRAAARAAKAWAEVELIPSFEPDAYVLGEKAYRRFCEAHPRFVIGNRPFGIRAFYSALREAGYAVVHDTRQNRATIPGVEFLS